MKSSVLHHLLDTLLSIPSLLLAIIVVAILGPGLFNTLIAITLALIPPFIRATYNAVHAEMQKEYIIASRLDGSPPQRIMRLAILPNIVETLVTQTTRTLSAAILDISAVGFPRSRGPVSPAGSGVPCWPTRAILSIWPLDGDPARDGHPVQRAGDQPGGRRHSRSTQRRERLMLPALLSIPAPGRPERPGCALNGETLLMPLLDIRNLTIEIDTPRARSRRWTESA